MAYEPYATPEYYQDTYNGSMIPADQLEKALREASRHIDSLTYNRIVGRGMSLLTPFQQDVIREVVCQQADFEYEMRMRSARSCKATASTAYQLSW